MACWLFNHCLHLLVFFLHVHAALSFATLGLLCCTQAFSSCSVQVPHRGGFFCYRAQALSAQALVVAVNFSPP